MKAILDLIRREPVLTKSLLVSIMVLVGTFVHLTTEQREAFMSVVTALTLLLGVGVRSMVSPNVHAEERRAENLPPPEPANDDTPPTVKP